MKANLIYKYLVKESGLPVFFFWCLIFINISNLLFLAVNPDNSSKFVSTFSKQIDLQNRQIKAIAQQTAALKKSLDKLNSDFVKELSFKEGLKLVLGYEGGLSNYPGDRGGLTNLGITHSEYEDYRHQKGLPPQSVAQISAKEARDIYRTTYWINSGCGDTPRRVALSCFDWQVNSGMGVVTLQQVLGVAVDGILGPITMNELNSWESSGQEDKLLHNYFERRENDYLRWGVGSQHKFLAGWLNRAEDLKDYLHVA